MITVKIENAYSDGHESTREVIVPPPETEAWDADEGRIDPELLLEAWWQEIVYPETGDGHGVDHGSCYVATIIATDDPDLLGQTCEWND